MVETTGNQDWLGVVVPLVFCALALGLVWLSGARGWGGIASTLTVLIALSALTLGSLQAMFANGWLLFSPTGDMRHAAGVALLYLGLNGILVLIFWLVVVLGLRTVAASRRRTA